MTLGRKQGTFRAEVVCDCQVFYIFRDVHRSSRFRFSDLRRFFGFTNGAPTNFLHNFELEGQFFSAADGAEVELPKLSGETESRRLLIQIDDELQTNCPPKIGQRYIRADRSEPGFGIERKELPLVDKTIERVTVEVVLMRGVGRPIRI